MRIVRLRAREFLGIEEVELSPGRATTVISGKNDTGKTSILKSFLAVFGGGSDVRLLRNGAESGEVLVDFDDGSSGRLRVTRDGVTRDAVGPDGKKIKSPTKYLSDLADGVALNPLAILRANPKQRVACLIETVPVSVSADEITRATGFPFVPNGDERNGFDLIERLRKHFYDERTGVNAQITSKIKTIGELEQTLPEGSVDVGDLAALRKDKEQLVAEQEAQKGKASRARAEAERQIASGSEAKRTELREKANIAIRAIEAQLAQDLASVDEKAKGFRTAAEAAEREVLDQVAAAFSERLADLSAQIAAAEERQKAADRAASTREAIAKYRAEETELRKQVVGFEAALKGIDDLKATLVSRVPIKGLEVRDGEIYLNGVALDHLNEEKQIRFALKLASLRMGDLPLVVIDGAEALDSEHQELYRKTAADMGIQLIMTATTDTPGVNVSVDGAPSVPVSTTKKAAA